MLGWIALAAGALLGVPLVMYLVQDSLLFLPQPLAGPPPATRAARPVEALALEAADGVPLRGWLLPGAARPAPLVVYYGGNAEEVSWQAGEPRWPREWALALVNYRGYGESGGRPSERALVADALLALDALRARPDVDPGRVVLFGRSLGSGVAVAVAAARPVAGVILVSPFESMVAVARRHYPWLPVRLLLRHPFDAAARAPAIRAPLLAIAAGRDEVIPPVHSRRLVEAWGGPTRWLEVPGADHDAVGAGPAFWDAVAAFLGEVAAGPPRP
jgi:pimeloyl-ACP methyl ester carboxylesterase